MRFYNRQHRHYCGIDLHVKTMFVCILDATGQVLVHRNVPSTPRALLEVVALFSLHVPGRPRAPARFRSSASSRPGGLATRRAPEH